jgi:hypothetical protein
MIAVIEIRFISGVILFQNKIGYENFDKIFTGGASTFRIYPILQ